MLAPSLGRGCRAQRGGVGFLFFAAKPFPLCLPHWGKALCREKRCSRFAAFPTRGRLYVGDSGIPIQPPPLRGTSFQRKEGVSTRAPSLGRGCRAQRGGVGFLFFAAKPLPLCLPHWGKALCREKRCSRFAAFPTRGRGTAPAVDRVLSLMAHLRRSFPLSFIPLEPYPARSARHLPHAGKALCRG